MAQNENQSTTRGCRRFKVEGPVQKPIVVVGSINLDLVARADHLPQPGETIIGTSFTTFSGGKGANQAVAVARLGYPVAMVGNVGDDGFGRQLLQAMRDAGVDTTFVSAVPGSSGVALITTGRRGENNIVVVPGANGLLTPQLVEKASAALRGAGFLLAQLEIPLETVEYLAVFAVRHGVPLMLDPAPARELPAALLRNVTWITPNETEAEALLKAKVKTEDDAAIFSPVDQLSALGAENVLLKLGARGCAIAEGHQAKQRIRVPAFPVPAVDTTAAGDAFNAAFAVGLLRGKTAMQSAVSASAVAAISVTRAGAQPSLPTAIEVEEFLQRHSDTGREP
jgi:ribokinase